MSVCLICSGDDRPLIAVTHVTGPLPLHAEPHKFCSDCLPRFNGICPLCRGEFHEVIVVDESSSDVESSHRRVSQVPPSVGPPSVPPPEALSPLRPRCQHIGCRVRLPLHNVGYCLDHALRDVVKAKLAEGKRKRRELGRAMEQEPRRRARTDPDEQYYSQLQLARGDVAALQDALQEMDRTFLEAMRSLEQRASSI